MSAERVLITGGSGYFGSRLVQHVLAAGHRCRVFDLVDADDRPREVEFVQGDIRDAAAVARATDGMDVVLHNVAQVPLAKNRALFESVNVTGTANILSAAQRIGVRKVVYTSSSAVYGAPAANPVTEATPRRPGEAYGRAKAEGEVLCERFAREGLDVSIVRPRTILGHGRLGIFQILFEWIREGRNVPVLGAGSNRYQFVHADDLATACLLTAARPGATSYNIGAQVFGTMRELLERLCGHAGTGSRVRSVPAWPAVVAMRATSAVGLSPLGAYHALMYGRSMYFDTARAQAELGWRAAYSNDQMICASYDWYLANRERVAAQVGQSAHRSPVRQGVLSVLKHVF